MSKQAQRGETTCPHHSLFRMTQLWPVFVTCMTQAIEREVSFLVERVCVWLYPLGCGRESRVTSTLSQGITLITRQLGLDKFRNYEIPPFHRQSQDYLKTRALGLGLSLSSLVWPCMLVAQANLFRIETSPLKFPLPACQTHSIPTASS